MVRHSSSRPIRMMISDMSIESRRQALAFKHEPSGGERKEARTDTENQSRNELETERNSPSGGSLAGTGTTNVWFTALIGTGTRIRQKLLTVSTVADPVRNHDSESNGQLLKSDQRTPNTGRSQLGIEHRNKHRKSTDTHTCEPSTSWT